MVTMAKVGTAGLEGAVGRRDQVCYVLTHSVSVGNVNGLAGHVAVPS